MKSKVKKFLIILNIFLVIAILSIIIYQYNNSPLITLNREAKSVFGTDYTITAHKLSGNDYVISAYAPEELYEDMDEKVDQFIDTIKGYRVNKDINKIILNVGYHTEDTKYIKSTMEIDLSNNNYK